MSSSSTSSSISSISSKSSLTSSSSLYISSLSSLSSKSWSSLSSQSSSSTSSSSSSPYSISSFSSFSSSSFSSSSSTSIDSLSSSSSSYLDKHGYKLLPFSFTSYFDKKINTIVSYNESLYAGTNENGNVIKSTNGFNWSIFYTTNDTCVSSLMIKDVNLYIGTSPLATPYKINLNDNTVKKYKSLYGTIISIVDFNNEIYLITSKPSNVYKYDLQNDQWNIIYKVYSNTINQVKVLNNKLYLLCDGENIISYDGLYWNIEVNISNVKNTTVKEYNLLSSSSMSSDSSISSMSQDILYGSYDSSSFENKVTYVKSYNAIELLNMFPLNRVKGTSCLESISDTILIGSSNNARIFLIKDNMLELIFDTAGNKINCMLSIDNSTLLASIDNKIFLLIKDDNNSHLTGIPVLHLNNEQVTYMTKEYDSILFGTSNGRILSCNKIYFNAYLTGNRNIYADVWNEYGYKSTTAISNITYALYHKIIELNSKNEIISQKTIKDSAISLVDNITATFVSTPLYIKDDVGFWNELIWEETKPENTEVRIFLRNAHSIQELYTLDWKYCFTSTENETGIISRKLESLLLNNKYMQIKAEITTNKKYITPTIKNIIINYVTKYSSYFYTVKFSLDKTTDIKNGLITANINQPTNTEITFGVSNTETNDWNNYKTIPINTLFSLDNYKNIKIGIKLSSYTNSYPSVDEFSIMLGDKLKQVIKA